MVKLIKWIDSISIVWDELDRLIDGMYQLLNYLRVYFMVKKEVKDLNKLGTGIQVLMTSKKGLINVNYIVEGLDGNWRLDYTKGGSGVGLGYVSKDGLYDTYTVTLVGGYTYIKKLIRYVHKRVMQIKGITDELTNRGSKLSIDFELFRVKVLGYDITLEYMEDNRIELKYKMGLKVLSIKRDFDWICSGKLMEWLKTYKALKDTYDEYISVESDLVDNLRRNRVLVRDEVITGLDAY